MLKLEEIIACPKCHSNEFFKDNVLKCKACNFEGISFKNIISTLVDQNSYFDDLHSVMTTNNENTNVFKLCYERQIKFIEENLKPGMVVLDIGCGPAIAYKKPEEVFLIGVEPSLPSLLANDKLNLQLNSLANTLPLKSKSVDMIICLYSIHHMIGSKKSITRKNVTTSLQEFKRVIKPGGKIIIFEVNPWKPFYALEIIGWNFAKKILRSKCDFYFWSRNAMLELGSNIFTNSRADVKNYNIGWTDTFPPAFALQGFKVPRFLYPFDVNSFEWSF